MTTKKRNRFRNAVMAMLSAGLVALALLGCDPAEPAEEAAPPAEEPAPAEQPAVPDIDALDDGVLTYATGVVDSRIDRGEWDPADIGLQFTSEYCFRTGQNSNAELQFADFAVVHLSSDSMLTVASLVDTGDTREATVELGDGGALRGRVDRLIGNEEFRVETGSTVAGVRGTAFEIETDEQGRTTVAVSSGEVSLRSRAAYDVRRRLEEVVDEDARLTLSALLDDLDDTYTVSADQQTVVEVQDFAEVDEQLASAEDTARELDRAPEAEREQLRERLQTLSDEIRRTGERTRREPEPLSEERRERLSDIEQTLNFRYIARVERAEELGLELQGLEAEELAAALEALNEREPVAEEPAEDAAEDAAPEPAATPAAVAQLVRFGVEVEPADAVTRIPGRPASQGSVRGLYRAGQEVTVRVEREGYEPFEETVTLGSDPRQEMQVTLLDRADEPEADPDPVDDAVAEEPPPEDPVEDEPAQVGLEVSSSPDDAELWVNGRRVGQGSYRGTFRVGERVSLAAERAGYERAEQELSVEEDPQPVSLQLTARPVEDRVSLSDDALVGELAIVETVVAAGDTQGRLAAFELTEQDRRLRGNALWSSETGNSFNENSYAVAIGDEFHFSGSSEWRGFRARDGEEVQRRELPDDAAHMFGRAPVDGAGRRVYPEDRTLRLYDSGWSETESIELPGGSSMKPLLENDYAFIADNSGTFKQLSLVDGSVQAAVDTAAVQPLGHAPVRAGDLVVFAGRRGTVFGVDTEAERVVWERRLDEQENVTVVSDIAVSDRGLYLFAGNRLFALDASNGDELFSPIDDVAAAPAVFEDMVVFGTRAGDLVFVGQTSGREVKRQALNGVPSTRPLVYDRRVLIGTADGEVVILHPDGVAGAR